MKVQRKIYAWILIVVLFTQSFGINALYGLYDFDQNLFVELFCINKYNPELKCNGTCLLSKLDDQSSQNKDKPVPQNIKELQLTFVVQTTNTELPESTSTIKLKKQWENEHLHCSQYTDQVFRPPILV